MADNVNITPGSGATVATDDVAGVHIQKVKIVDGTADSATAIPGDATNGLDVDVTRMIPGTGGTNLGKIVDAVAGGSDVGVLVLAVRDDTLGTVTPADGDYTQLRVDSSGALHTRISGGTATLTGAVDATLVPATAGGLTPIQLLDLDETDRTVKAGAGVLYGWFLANTHATLWRYVKLYNALIAGVTVGTTTPVMTIPLPPSSAANVPWPTGIAFSAGITAACTTAAAVSDTGAPGTNDVHANFMFA